MELGVAGQSGQVKKGGDDKQAKYDTMETQERVQGSC